MSSGTLLHQRIPESKENRLINHIIIDTKRQPRMLVKTGRRLAFVSQRFFETTVSPPTKTVSFCRQIAIQGSGLLPFMAARIPPPLAHHAVRTSVGGRRRGNGLDTEVNAY